MLKIFRLKTVRVLCIFLLMFITLTLIISGKKLYRSNVENQVYNVESLTNEQIKEAVSDSTKKLMIVAHPDDEVLWGGGHLMSGDYLVVCITNGRDETRAKEFADVAKASNNDCIILKHPDKVAGKRDNWSKVKSKILKDIESIMTYKKWDEIVTHNSNGEYGHVHHQTLHSLVTEIYDRDNIDSELYCFGKYYRKSKIDSVKDKLVPLSEEEYEFKKKLADIYVSQKSTVDSLWHMSRYEMLERYERYTEHPQIKKKTASLNEGTGALNEA